MHGPVTFVVVAPYRDGLEHRSKANGMGRIGRLFHSNHADDVLQTQRDKQQHSAARRERSYKARTVLD
jgi:hypothetical protein